MDQSIQNPQTSTGRLLKTDSERKRSLSQERKQFIEEEYDFLCREIASWLSQLAGKEIHENLVDELEDGTVLCDVVKNCLPKVTISKYHDNAVDKGSFYAKDNIAVFSHACQEMGINKNDCLNPSMFENNERKLIVNCLLHFALKGLQFGLKPIELIHSDRLQSFVEAMPEDIVKGIREMAEKEKPEEKTEEKPAEEKPAEEKPAEEKPAEEEHMWDRQDDINVCTIILFMFAVLAGMFYLVYAIDKQGVYCVFNNNQIKLNLDAPNHYTFS